MNQLTFLRRRWVLAVCLLILLAGVMYGSLNLVLNKALQHAAIPWLERAIPGLSLSVSRINSDLISKIEAYDIVFLYDHKDGSRVEAQLAKVQLDFSLADLKTNLDTLISKAHIQAEITSGRVDFADSPSEGSASMQIGLLPIPLPLPAINLKYGSLAVFHSYGHIATNQGEVSAPGFWRGQDNQSLPVRLSAGKVALTAGTYEETFEKIKAEGAYGSCEITMARLSINGEDLVKDFLMQSQEGTSSLQATLSIWGGRVNLQAEIAEEVKAKFNTAGVNLEKIDLHLVPQGLPKTGTMLCAGELAFPVANPSAMTGQLRLTLNRANLFSVPVDSFDLEAAVGNGLLFIRELKAANPHNTIHLEAVQLPVAELVNRNWAQLAGSADGRLQLSIGDIPAFKEILPESVNSFINEYGVNTMHLQGRYQNGVAEIHAASLGSTTAAVRAHTVVADLNPWRLKNDWQSTPLSANLEVDTKNLDLLKMFMPAPPNIVGDLTAALTLKGLLGTPNLAFEVHGNKVTLLEKVEFEKIKVIGKYRNSELNFDTVEVINGPDTLDGGLIYRPETKQPLTADLKFQIAAIGPYLPDHIRQQLKLKGDLSGQIHIHQNADTLMAESSLAANSIWIDDTKFEQARIEANLAGNDLFIKKIQVVWPAKELLLQSTLAVSKKPAQEQFLVTLDALSAFRRGQTLTLAHQANITYDSGRISTRQPLIFQAETANFSLTGAVSSESLDIKLAGEIYNGKKFLETFGPVPFFFQTALFEADIKKSLDDPQINLSGSIKQITAEETPPLDGIFSLAYADDQLTIDQLTVSDALSPRLTLQGQAPLSIKNGRLEFVNGPLKIAGNFNLQSSPLLPWLLQNKLQEIGSVQGKVDLEGTWQNPVGLLQISAGNLLLKDIPDWLPAEPISIGITLAAEKDKLIIQSGTVDSTIASLQFHGTAVNPDFPDQFESFNRQQVLEHTEIDLQGTSVMKEIDWLAERYEMLRRTSGQATADFHLIGTMAKPRYTATFSLHDGEIRLNSDMPPLQEVSLQAELNDTALAVKQFSGSLGGAPIKGHGTITLPGTNGQVSMDLSLTGNDLLFYRADGIKFRGDTSLRVLGALDQPQLSGDIVLTDTKITRNIDFLSSLLSGLTAKETPAPKFPAITEAPLRDALLNLKLTAKEPVLLSNNIFKGKITPNLELRGTGEVPFLSGSLYITDASLTLPAGKIKITSGVINFLKTDPDRPVLELSGEAKMLGYDISIGISGPYDAPVILLSSSPSLPNEELLMLLLAGKRPASETTQQNQTTNYSSVVMYFGQSLVKSLWSNGDAGTQETILDRLQLEIGRNITQHGEETIEAQFTLAENIKNGKNAILITGERDAWDKYNGGLRLVFKFQ